ncbi:hypothetical protein ACLM45_00710 [Synechococcus sp. A10-1-5-9]|uniref:hypothetical protein n=1 Tax=Synechococcus sp. A10-1-5-9 TaxID=3392295 RepID=UPI0039E9759E
MADFLNCVRIVVKQGCEKRYLDAVEAWVFSKGMRERYLARTGERAFCFVALWDSQDSLVEVRPEMFQHLNSVRDLLEELSPELRVTDPVSGPVIHCTNG